MIIKLSFEFDDLDGEGCHEIYSVRETVYPFSCNGKNTLTEEEHIYLNDFNVQSLINECTNELFDNENFRDLVRNDIRIKFDKHEKRGLYEKRNND